MISMDINGPIDWNVVAEESKIFAAFQALLMSVSHPSGPPYETPQKDSSVELR